MEQPRRTQPPRNARSAPNTLSPTSPQSALKNDVPQVLERSTSRLADVKQCTDVVTGPGILVKLFPVDDSNRTLWIVGSPYAKKWISSKVEEMRTANANAKANDRTKASHPAKARPASTHEAKARLNSEKAVTQKKQGSGARGEKKATEQQVHENQDESDDMNNEPEGDEDEEEEEEDAEENDAVEEDAREDDAREDDAGEDTEENLHGSEEEEDLEEGQEKDAVVDEENGDDREEQDDDGHNEPSDQAGGKEADKMEDEDYGSEEDLAEDTGEKGEREAEGQQEAERDGERDGERNGEDTTSDEAQMHSKTRGEDGAVEDGEEEENGDEVREEQGDHGNAQGVRECMEQQVTEKNRDGVWRSWKVGDTNGKENEERCTNAGEEERTAEDEDGSPEERRKRPLEKSEAFTCSTPEERPNKRRKSDGDRNGVDTTTEDSLNRTTGLKAQTRPRTPSLKSTTPSPPSTIEIVRQTSVVPGLEGTESAVWDAAQRDSIINSLPLEQQTKMIHAALSLGSKEGIEALQHFVQNARKEGKRRRENLQSDTHPGAPHFGVDVWHATRALVSRDSSLAHFSDLYRQLDILDNKVTLFSIAKRVQLAAMAQYRKSLLQESAGRNQTKDANLHLFHTVYPDHAMIRNPDDEEKSSAARCDWNRLCNRLREGKMWLEVRDLFGGVGAFIALPPQCVSDRHILRMPARNFGSWLRLLEVAWRALDAHARRTLNNLVRMSLAGQPLPEEVLALETLEDGPGTTPTSLSDILTGWSLFERKSRDDEGDPTATTHREDTEEDGDRAALGPPSTTASTANRQEEAEDSGLCSREVLDVDDGLLKDLNFDDVLSQEI